MTTPQSRYTTLISKFAQLTSNNHILREALLHMCKNTSALNGYRGEIVQAAFELPEVNIDINDVDPNERNNAALIAQNNDLKERMTRSRDILTHGNPMPECNYGMLDVSHDGSDGHSIQQVYTLAELKMRDAQTLRNEAKLWRGTSFPDRAEFSPNDVANDLEWTALAIEKQHESA